MNLHETVKKMLGYHITKENALKFVDEQFGAFSTYIRDNCPRQPNKYDAVTKVVTTLEIEEDALIHGVVLELEHYQLTKFGNETLYFGSVFKQILEHYESGEIQFPMKTLHQLKELNELFGKYDYIRVMNKKG